MKYRLCDECKVVQNENELLIINQRQNSEISLNIDIVEFEKILNGYRLTSIINNQNSEDSIAYLDALKNFNSLIYVMLDQKLIEPINEYAANDRKIWLKSCLLELTDCCNFRCPHCYVDKSSYNRVSFKMVQNLASELLNLNCNKITLTGGEVLTHNEFISIYKHLYKNGFIIGINTNGSLFDDEIIKTLSQMPPYAIEISLYGHDQASYQNFTKTDSFNSVINNIKKLKSAGITLVLKNIITNSNKNHFSNIRKLAHDLGVEFRSDYISFPQINGPHHQNPEQISVEGLLRCPHRPHGAAAAHFLRRAPQGYRHHQRGQYAVRSHLRQRRHDRRHNRPHRKRAGRKGPRYRNRRTLLQHRTSLPPRGHHR